MGGENKRRAEAEPEDTAMPKLPKTVANALPAALVETIESSAEDPLTVKRFEHARRFTKELRFVELYWDGAGEGKVKVVEGDIARTEELEQVGTIGPIAEHNALCTLAAPTSHWVAVQDMAAEAEKRATALKADGFEELEDFVKLHALSIPCFTWLVSDGPPPEDAAVTSSRIAGSLASYGEDDEFKKAFERKISFQVDLASLPTRMQAIAGKSGLLQVFLGNEFDGNEEDAMVRIIPEEDFGKLVSKPLSTEGIDREAHPPALAITGWAEHADYPGDEYDPGQEDEGPKPGDESYDPLAWLKTDPLLEKAHALRLKLDKFGGYSIYKQSDGTLGDKVCESCGETHLFARAVFNMVDTGMLRAPLSDSGTLQVSYCCNANPIEAWSEWACC